MAGKGRQTARKPATKFAHLRKKMKETLSALLCPKPSSA